MKKREPKKERERKEGGRPREKDGERGKERERKLMGRVRVEEK
jgi:hypothetical protein